MKFISFSRLPSLFCRVGSLTQPRLVVGETGLRPKSNIGRFVVMLAVLSFPWVVHAKPAAHTQVTLLSEKTTIAPGEAFDVGILLKIDKGWHTYYKDPGDSGLATSIKWDLPKGYKAGPIRWPKPETISLAGLTTYAYENEVLLLTRVERAASFEPQAAGGGVSVPGDVKIVAHVDWLECAAICVPGDAEVSLNLKVGEKSQNASAEVLALFEKYRAQLVPENYKPAGPVAAGPLEKARDSATEPAALKVPHPTLTFWTALAGGFLGGLILNLMPCVLPIIAIKILGFVKQSHDQPARARQLGLVFGLGVVVSFWALAAGVIALQSAGRSVGWGSILFQEPIFLMIMSLVVVMIALNFFGLFEFALTPSAVNAAGGLATRGGYFGAFMNGVLATTLATPCTAPFLAPALGFAFSQSALVIFAIFTAVGVGLAFPYVLLAWKPSLLKCLPKPGAWMGAFKQAMGFPMLATALWLLWNLSSHDSNAAFFFMGWVMLATFVVWILSVWFPGRATIALVAAAVVGWLGISQVSAQLKSMDQARSERVTSQGLIEWRPYSQKALEEALAGSGPVFIDFTANWCLTCQVNKRTSLEAKAVAARLKELHVTAFLADWTKSDTEITKALSSFGRSGVPLYVLYPADRSKPPILLPEVLTPQIVLDALEAAARG